MKRFYAQLMMLVFALATGLSASAFTVNCEWNLPGAVEIKTDSYRSGAVVGPASADDLSYSLELDGSKWVYIMAKEGYKITAAEFAGAKVNPNFISGFNYAGKFITAGGTFKVTVAPIAKTDSFTVNVENGASYIDCELSNGENVELKNGENTVAYDPDLVTSVSFAWTNGAPEFYSFTVNGEPKTKKFSWDSYIGVNPIQNGDVIAIKVFENGEPVVSECKVTVVLPEGMENCINTIRNWTKSAWETLDNGQLTLTSGTDIAFNFKTDDYTYTGFNLNGVSIFDKYKNGTLRFVVEEDCTLTVEGSATVWNDIDYTAYIMNPEGVVLYNGGYMKNEVDLSTGGTAITSPITLASSSMTAAVTMTGADTYSYTIPVSEKSQKLFVAPKEGWYIYTVQQSVDGKLEEVNHVEDASTVFYVVAKKYDAYAHALVNVEGSGSVKLSASAVKSKMWDNETTTFSIKAGDNTVNFLPGYDTPLSLRGLGVANLYAYLDGAALTADDNGLYSIDPYYAAAGQEQTLESVVNVFTSTTPSTTKVKVTAATGLSAKLYYSPIRHEGKVAGQSLLPGTIFTVVPSTADCVVTVNGTEVALNENGEYTGIAEGSSMDVNVAAKPKLVAMTLKPADGAVVKKLKEVEFILPVPESWNLYYFDTEKIQLLNSMGMKLPVSFELGELTMTTDETGYIYPFNLSIEIEDDGMYYLNVDEGAFFEVEFDEPTESFVAVAGGNVSSAVLASYTVDSTLKSAVEDYKLLPAEGSTVETLTYVTIEFPQIGKNNWQLRNDEELANAFTCGDKSYQAMVTRAWEHEADCLAMMVIPCTEAFEEVELPAGEWTLSIPAGFFTFEGETSPAIKATWKVDNSVGINGTVVDGAEKTVFTVDGKKISSDKLQKGIYIINGKKSVVK